MLAAAAAKLGFCSGGSHPKQSVDARNLNLTSYQSIHIIGRIGTILGSPDRW